MEKRGPMKHLLILVVIAFLASFGALFSVINGQSSPKEKRPRLTVELSADKAVYRPKDDINLKVMVKNDELSDDVFVYGDMGFGYSASFTLFRRDAKGREVPTRFIDDYRGNPPNLDDPNTFVKLSSGTFLGIGYENSIYNLNLERPGRYRLWVEYHSPISRSEVKVRPYWGSEDGTVKSNVLEILVRP
jgi:hypothetical protein